MSPTDTDTPAATSRASEHLAQFEADGYTIFRDVIDPELVAEADAHVDWLLRRHPDLRPERLHHFLAVDDPFWHRLVSDGRLLDIAELFVGPDLALFATQYICKQPRDGQPVLWHQDGVFWPLEPMEVASLWLAVTDSTPDNGCLRVIPGTHRTEASPYRSSNEVANVLGAEIDREVDERDAVDLVLAPGDVSVHHENIVHGSNANHSDRWRRGLTIRYVPTTTRILEPEKASPFHLRGERGNVNTYLDVPVYVPGLHHPFAEADRYARA